MLEQTLKSIIYVAYFAHGRHDLLMRLF